jgi:hypothetical protein
MKRDAKRNSSVLRHFAAAMKLAKRFPGIESDTCYGTPAIRVNGKFMGRLRTEAEGWLAIRCDFEDREILLQAAPHVFHVTPHYQNYPMILVDLAAVDDDTLVEIVERAWGRQAPKKLVREFEERHNTTFAPSPTANKRPAKQRAVKKSPTQKRPVKKPATKKR